MRLTRKAFRAWLEAHGPRQIVGVSDHCLDCPIARFTGRAAPPDWPGHWPIWAGKFVDAVDGMPRGRMRVTASRALKILDSIP